MGGHGKEEASKRLTSVHTMGSETAEARYRASASVDALQNVIHCATRVSSCRRRALAARTESREVY
jgi:hypothetical protein